MSTLPAMTSAIAVPAVIIGPQWEWGDRLRKIRRSVVGVSQPQMAALIGIRATTYAAWEAGRTTPSHRIAHAVAHRIESLYPGRVSAAWVLGAATGDTADEDLLPRMDSNHQPCGCESQPCLKQVCTCDQTCTPLIPDDPSGLRCKITATDVGEICPCLPWMNTYLEMQPTVKIYSGVSGENLGTSWGGMSA